VATTGAGVVVMATACSAPDPGQVTFSERQHGSGDTTSGGSSGDTSSSGMASSSGASGTSGTDGGTSGTSGSMVIDAFTPAPAYAAGAANGTSNNASHPNGNQNPAGNNCLDCHKNGGAGTPWVFAGTVYKDVAGAAAVGAGIEVRMVDSTGNEQAKVYTDAN